MNQLTTLTFELKQNLIVLKCKVNDEIRTFILDSGAPQVILNSRFQERSNYENYKGTLKGVTGDITKCGLMNIDYLRCGRIEKHNVESLVMDLSQLEEAIQEEVFGLIGYDFFSEYNVYLNYQNLKLGFWNDLECEDFLLRNKHQSYIFCIDQHLPIIECRIEKTTCQLALDTGANTNLIDVKLQESLNTSMTFEEDGSNIIGANVETAISAYMSGSMKNLEVEGVGNFSKMNTVFADVSHLNQNTSASIHGVLGYEFLSQQQVIIGFSTQKLYILRSPIKLAKFPSHDII